MARYGGSLFRALKSVYSGASFRSFSFLTHEDVPWKQEWFENISKYNSSYWSIKQNQLIFLNEFAQKNRIVDWSRTSVTLLKKNGGYVSIFMSME